METKSERQIRHEKLIDFLARFPHYLTEDGEPRLKKVKNIRPVHKVDKISPNDITEAVCVFADTLNMCSGSAGDFSLYRLLQAYLTMPGCRAGINTLVNEAHSRHYQMGK